MVHTHTHTHTHIYIYVVHTETIEDHDTRRCNYILTTEPVAALDAALADSANGPKDD